ncbi:MarR family winged helix-turn-helix transcriptional regulator [Pseudonocardia sp. CA-107938]|uniref:MarR family winged helix-turn-helix transcriptional regulator n=1 Tax=Pseudonocardia sp. CA-107938 TaxID=3240021 RepID=UPI003D904673
MHGDDEGCGHDADRAPARLRGTAFWLLGRAALIAQKRTNERLVEAGLQRGFYGVLATLVEFGPAAQAEIGRRLRIDPSDMVAIVTALVAEGLVTRERDPDDRRRNLVTPTPAGRAKLDHFDAAIAAEEDALLDRFTPAERAQLLELLHRLT